MGSGGSRGLQNRWLLKFAMAGSIPASSVFILVLKHICICLSAPLTKHPVISFIFSFEQ